jgi:hypothetical protein
LTHVDELVGRRPTEPARRRTRRLSLPG